MQEPGKVARVGEFTVALAEQPESLAGLVLDAEVVAHRVDLRIALPPLPENPFGAVGPFTRRRWPHQTKAAGG